MRQLAAFERARADLQKLECSVVAAVADTQEQVGETARSNGLAFPIAYGCSREDADAIGAWWSENRGGHVDPSEFLLGRGGKVLAAMYASGPLGRMSPDEIVRFITGRERRRQEALSRGPLPTRGGDPAGPASPTIS